MELEMLVFVMILQIIVMIIVAAMFLWGIISIENAIRDDLKRYKKELTINQLNTAIDFLNRVKNEDKEDE